ncbi:recombinase zinc beta ribbon domain-containing protein [Anaerosporobacter sp.]|uniref:recombinase zinc beta ribbon domain-containing protein n=1 Tax=Anaerosporobacter sp. TaxID=1872529 RepID=UPI002F40FBDC
MDKVLPINPAIFSSLDISINISPVPCLKGDALLQKSVTIDYLSKKRVKNEGQAKQYYVHDSHPAIIDKEFWECVQLEMARRKQYLEAHGLNSYAHKPAENPFASKVICGMCNQAYGRVTWRSTTPRRVWQCGLRYRRKGVIGCDNRHVDDEVFVTQFINSFKGVGNWYYF